MVLTELLNRLNLFYSGRQFNDAILLLEGQEARSRLNEAARLLLICKLDYELGRIARAIDCLRPFAQHSPDHAFTWGRLLHATGQIELAEAAWEPYWQSFEPHYQLPLYLQSLLVSPTITQANLYAKHVYWAAKILDQYTPNLSGRWSNLTNKKIHVAYFAAYWGGTTIRRTFTHHLKFHNREDFRIFGYSSVPIPTDIEQSFDQCRIIPHNVGEVIKIAQDDKIDIFLDTTGLTPGSKFPSMALRIAPIQYNYLNHLSTCGIPNVDYIIGDYTAPDPNQQTYFAEQISRMKGCFLSFCYENSIAFEETPPSHTNPFVVFGCLSSQGKIGSLFLKACAQIVSHSANFRLLFRNHFLTDPNNKRLFFEIASLQGINLDQLILLDGCTNDAVLATYGQIDISLDTFPYNGGNTVCESLWQGVPVITLRGNKFAGQYAASILINSSLQELVTDSIQNYVATAINLAKDKTRLLEYRRSLRSRITKSKFNDGKFFAERLEEIFSRDYSTWKTRNGPGFPKGAWKDIALSD